MLSTRSILFSFTLYKTVLSIPDVYPSERFVTYKRDTSFVKMHQYCFVHLESSPLSTLTKTILEVC